jgi:alkanesulfonate monooxygenase SsuD/methylene tetrahydromethanopterin reductase-like flavin-dependent oxidoreductase (luciferase family)
MAFTDIFRNARGLGKPPIDDIDSYWTRAEKFEVSRMLECSVVGSPETVRAGLELLIKRTRADELMIVSDIFDHATRLRSFDLVAAVAKPLIAAG